LVQKVAIDNKYLHWKAVVNANIQMEPSKEDWKLWINNAIGALKKETKMSNAEIVRLLLDDFGLPEWKIYNLMDDGYKREYEKQEKPPEEQTEALKEKLKKDESKSRKSDFGGKAFGNVSEFFLEKMLVKEFEKLGVKPETKVPIDRAYPYPYPYIADIKLENIIIDVEGKSLPEELTERDAHFKKLGMYPIHLPRSMVQKFTPNIASLIYGFVTFWKEKAK
jgi:hypothetical protein